MGGSLRFRASVAGATGAVWLMGWVGPASATTLDLLLGDKENPGAAMLTSYDGTVMFSDFAYHPIRQGPLPRTSEVLPEPNHPDGLVIQTVEGSFDAYGGRSLHVGLGYDAIVLFGNFVWAGGLGGPSNARTVIWENVLGNGQHLIEGMNLLNYGFDRMDMSEDAGLTTLPCVPGGGAGAPSVFGQGHKLVPEPALLLMFSAGLSITLATRKRRERAPGKERNLLS